MDTERGTNLSSKSRNITALAEKLCNKSRLADHPQTFLSVLPSEPAGNDIGSATARGTSNLIREPATQQRWPRRDHRSHVPCRP